MVFGDPCYTFLEFATLKQFPWTQDTVTTFCKAPSCIFAAPLRMVKQYFTARSCLSVGPWFGLSPLKVILLVLNQFNSQRGMKIKSRFR